MKNDIVSILQDRDRMRQEGDLEGLKKSMQWVRDNGEDSSTDDFDRIEERPSK